MERSREREFSELRDSRTSNRSAVESALSGRSGRSAREFQATPKRLKESHASSTMSEYICLNCENESLSKEKIRDRAERQAMERSRLLIEERRRADFEAKENARQAKERETERQKMYEANQEMVQQHEEGKRQ